MKTIIIGGVAGGASAATRLRRLDESHEIVVLERSGYVSFANCGLPYYIGGTIADRRNLLLQTPKSLNARFGLDVRVNSEVTSIDPGGRTVTVKDLTTGESYTEAYDHLVLSPGASPIVPPIPGVERALTLRTIEDTDRIKERVDALLAQGDSSEEAVGGESALSVVVVGGGFIGLEMAESLRERGMDVTVVELGTQVMAPLDPEMAALVAAELAKHGVHAGPRRAGHRGPRGHRAALRRSRDRRRHGRDEHRRAPGHDPGHRGRTGARPARRDQGRRPDAHLGAAHLRGRRRRGQVRCHHGRADARAAGQLGQPAGPPRGRRHLRTDASASAGSWAPPS